MLKLNNMRTIKTNTKKKGLVRKNTKILTFKNYIIKNNNESGFTDFQKLYLVSNTFSYSINR